MACGVTGVDGATVAPPVAKVVVPGQDCVTTRRLVVVVKVALALPNKLNGVKRPENVKVTYVLHCVESIDQYKVDLCL